MVTSDMLDCSGFYAQNVSTRNKYAINCAPCPPGVYLFQPFCACAWVLYVCVYQNFGVCVCVVSALLTMPLIVFVIRNIPAGSRNTTIVHTVRDRPNDTRLLNTRSGLTIHNKRRTHIRFIRTLCAGHCVYPLCGCAVHSLSQLALGESNDGASDAVCGVWVHRRVCVAHLLRFACQHGNLLCALVAACDGDFGIARCAACKELPHLHRTYPENHTRAHTHTPHTYLHRFLLLTFTDRM